MRILQIIPAWIRNKYFLTAVGFGIWMFFFDEQDFITTHIKQRGELQKLEESRAYYQKEIKSTKEELEQLKSDPAILEKYAREKYRMKRDNEDVYIIAEEVTQ